MAARLINSTCVVCRKAFTQKRTTKRRLTCSDECKKERRNRARRREYRELRREAMCVSCGRMSQKKWCDDCREKYQRKKNDDDS